MVMVTFQTRLKNLRKPTYLRIRFDLEKLNDPTVMSAFQATIGVDLVVEKMLIWIPWSPTSVTDTAAELLGKQRRKRKPWVTNEILDLCDQRRDMKKKRAEPKTIKRD